MVNKTEQHEDQAEELRKLLDEVQQKEKKAVDYEMMEANEETEQERNIDILNLPPRKEIHGNKKKNTHIKISVPFFRLIIVIVILSVVGIGAYYVYGDEIYKLITNS